MEQEKKALFIRSAIIPSFYQKFHCLAEKCQDNCCFGWKIHFDKKDYLRLRRLELPSELKERMSGGVRRIRGEMASDNMYAEFNLKNNENRCPFHSPEGLCGIQLVCGHDVLPHVCRSYPRHISYSPVAKEYSLSPSCEGVLEQLWRLPDGVKFIEEPLPKTENRTANIDRGGVLVLAYGLIRRTMIDILQNRALSLTERMLYLGIAIQRLQKEDWDSFDPEQWANQTHSLMDSDMIKELLGKITGNRMMFIMQNLKVLEVISRSEKRSWVGEVFDVLEVERGLALVPNETEDADPKVHLRMNFSLTAYEEALAEFEKAFSGQEYFFENLMVASAWYLSFPSLSSQEGLWKSYVSLCNLYSFYRFVSILGCKGQATKERLFHMIALSSRVTLHTRERFNGFQEELFQHNSSTLAHMAILLHG